MKKILTNILFISLPSIFLALVILEICLRLTGNLYNLSHNPGTYSPVMNSATKKLNILCLGDSFTFGVGTSPENSYPRQLERLLRENIDKDINVINAGRLANTSSLLLNNFKKDIARYNPDIVIVMVGLSNYWNLKESSYFILYKDKAGYVEKMNNVLSNLSIYKLIKIVYLKYRNGRLSKLNIKHAEKNEESLKFFFLGNELYLNGSYDLAKEKIQRALALDKDNHAAHLLLAQIYNARSEFKEGQEELRKTVETIDEWDEDLLYNVICQIQMQKGPRANKIELSKIKQCINAKYSGDNKKIRSLAKIIDARLDFLEDKQIHRRVLEYDLEETIRFAKSHGVTFILNTYPLDDLTLYDVFKEISNKLNIPLVDNFKVFKEIEKSGNIKDFLVPNGHCNAKGYGLIAENTYKILVGNKLLSDRRKAVSI